MQKIKLILQNVNWGQLGKNLLMFTAPSLIVLFGQLALKIDWRASLALALLTFYGSIVDFLKKYQASKNSLQ